MEIKEVVSKAYNKAYKKDKSFKDFNKDFGKDFKKSYNKKPYKKKNNYFILNIILEVVKIGILVAIWYELYVSNVAIFD